ncbi:MAG TPA: glycosyltransferase family 39 protein [Steroidobacteraceae bacterium]|nr:glycosyltransferase family 39 protein [Steroidobacteraceae bacterium]
MTRLPVARLLVLLVPVALVGLCARAYYTPDEPREASLVVAMAHQPDKALPELAGRPFAEKPPLLYWLGGASVAAFGPAPAAARLPNLLYLLVAALAIAALVSRVAGAAAGFAAGMAATTMLQLYQVLIWLATDAPLVAGVALALLGASLGLAAADPGARRRGYLVMHLGLALAFFAKGFAGWLVPASAWLTVVVLERRWRELWRAELWGGALVVLLAIGAWAGWVATRDGGVAALKVLFWYNLVGRAVPLVAPAGFAYAAGHANSPGKYLLELPLYLLPWTALAVAALRRLPRGLRRRDAEGSAWRLALGAIALPTLLLSLAATARGVYYAPPALGFAVLVGLYVGGAGAALDRFERIAWRVTGALLAATALMVGALDALVGFAPQNAVPGAAALGALGVAAAAAAAWLALTARTAGAAALPRYAGAAALVLSLAIAPLYLAINDWLSLERLAGRIAAAAGPAPLALIDPDETTLALAELYLPPGTARAVLLSADAGGLARAQAALGPQLRLLWLVPDRSRWDLRAWLGFLGYRPERPPPAAPPAVIPGGGSLRTECLLERAGGRTFALLAPVAAAPVAGTVCR